MEIVPIREYWSEILKSGETVYAGLIFRVPPRLWRPLARAQASLRNVDNRQLFAHPSTFHVSVKGLGYLQNETDIARYETALAKIGKIISRFSSFQIELRGIGIFPTAIYAKVNDSGVFKKINTLISEELKREVEQSRYDRSEYVPHVTLLTFNTSEASELVAKAESQEMRDLRFGEAGVFEIELVKVNLLLALGPEETQDRAYTYLRSFQLGPFANRRIS
ncbi:MAG: 2'-5' RNA ligase family protein [Nitrososphaerota archaeon]|nr:2'-5' RNA ligase family protein [Nitrososphaerota archaeon]